MTFWAFSGLVNGLTSFILGALVFIKDKRNERNVTYGLFCLSIFIWSISYFLWQISDTAEAAFFWCKMLMSGAVFIPICYLHHIYSLIGKVKIYYRRLIFAYLFGIISSILCFSTLFITGVSKKIFFPYWPNAGILFLPFLIIWFLLVILGAVVIIQCLKNASGILKNQMRYVLVATIIGWIGGATNFPLWFNIPIFPVGNILASVYAALVAYAIVKYRLMDIRLAVTNASIFITIYLLVLGIPFGVGFYLLGSGQWLGPMILMAILATSGPFLYLYFQRRAEAKILQEQRHYQATLRRASLGMGRIKDLKRLLGLIVHIVTKTVRIEHCSIYLFHEASKQYVLKSSKGKTNSKPLISVFPEESNLVQYLNKIKEPIVCEEIFQKNNDSKEAGLESVVKELNVFDCALIVPSFIEQRLLAIIVLGRKRSGKIYSHDDLVVFSILANQSALAIENAQFYEDMKRTHEQLFKAEKMATIGTMADGLSHQINNRLHAIGFVASDALDTVRITQKNGIPENLHEVMDDVAYALERIQDNVKRGGEIVGGLLKYTRKDSRGFEAVQIEKLFNAAIEMAGFKIKPGLVDFVSYLHPNLSEVHGNFTQLQEVFFNIIDNAYDAIVQRREDLKEEKYKGKIEITAFNKGKTVEVRIKDNGIGAKPEILAKLFTPFFTTKLSSRKGTGLGLYIIRQIIEENHRGSVKFDSRYGIGSETVIILPVSMSLPAKCEDSSQEPVDVGNEEIL